MLPRAEGSEEKCEDGGSENLEIVAAPRPRPDRRRQCQISSKLALL